MIVDIFLLFLSAWVALIGAALNAITSVIPDQFRDTVTYFFGFTHYVNSFINIPEIMVAFGWFLFFLVSYGTMKLILKSIEWMPFIGQKLHTKIF